jgi:hypothetical protein
MPVFVCRMPVNPVFTGDSRRHDGGSGGPSGTACFQNASINRGYDGGCDRSPAATACSTTKTMCRALAMAPFASSTLMVDPP